MLCIHHWGCFGGVQLMDCFRACVCTEMVSKLCKNKLTFDHWVHVGLLFSRFTREYSFWGYSFDSIYFVLNFVDQPKGMATYFLLFGQQSFVFLPFSTSRSFFLFSSVHFFTEWHADLYLSYNGCFSHLWNSNILSIKQK